MKRRLRTVRAVGDYTLGVLLLIGPWLFGFSDSLLASIVTKAFGAVIIALSLSTDYDLALMRRIPYAFRLGLDVAVGGLLIATPWIFGFAETTWIPHLVIGTVQAVRSCLWLLGLGATSRPLFRTTHRRRAAGH